MTVMVAMVTVGREVMVLVAMVVMVAMMEVMVTVGKEVMVLVVMVVIVVMVMVVTPQGLFQQLGCSVITQLLW